MLKKPLLSEFLNRFVHFGVDVVALLFSNNSSFSNSSSRAFVNANASNLVRSNSAGSNLAASALKNSPTTFSKPENSKSENKRARFRFGFQLLFLFTLLLGMVFSAQAATKFCSEFPNNVVDGNFVSPVPTQITIDDDCTFQNWSASNPLTATLNFKAQTPPKIYLIIFDNTHFIGNMACANIDHRIWFSNSSFNNINPKCQSLFIPVEAIDKQNPVGQVTATVGVPFTYTLTLPDYQFLGGPSINDLHTVTLLDDLTDTEDVDNDPSVTGADLTYVGINAYYLSAPTVPVVLVQAGDWTTKNLSYEPILLISAGEQLVVEITVVLDDTARNAAGVKFINKARWSFGRLIEGEFYTPLPGESGITPPMEIVEPNLQVTKTSTELAINLGVIAPFILDVHNAGGSDVWNATIVDKFPDPINAPPSARVGMCDFDPTSTVQAQILAADGSAVTGVLVQNVDYSVTFTATPSINPTACELSFTMLSSTAVIGPSEHLIIIYQTQLDGDTTANGATLTNVAGATEWFNSDILDVNNTPITYTRTLSDGTPLTADHEDSHTLTTTLSGFVFHKTVQNLTTGANPTATADAGDTLRYRLRLFNVDQIINNVTITDLLEDNRFDLNSFSVFATSPAGAIVNFNPVTRLLEISGGSLPLDVPDKTELIVDFDITLLSTLVNNTVVSNQALLNADGPTFTDIPSDDPSDGVGLPGDETPTIVTIQSPGSLAKASPPQASATIGEQFTYTITVPSIPVSIPLYDVRILDDLSASIADMQFVSANLVSGGTLSNTGTATSLVIENTSIGIDIPANGQAVIEITVQLQNTLTNNSALLPFSNSASFTYNRTNGNNATQSLGGAGIATDMTVVEPLLTVTKVGTTTPVANVAIGGGSIIEYVISITNNGDATAYDVNVLDTLPAELALYEVPTPTATATIGGTAVATFIEDPTDAPAGPLIWGRDNGDGSLDIPVGETLVLTYQAQVQVSTPETFDNTVWVDWTSLDGTNSSERTGACPTVTGLNDYCATFTSLPFTITDSNSLSKIITTDSYIDNVAVPPSTADDSTVRIGDTATYQLTLTLGEGTTNSVTVTDVLPTGMAFDSLVSITPASAPANLNYTIAAQPTAGDTGTLVWDFGDIINTPNDGTPDTLVIEYVVSVQPDAGIAQAPSTTLTNTATLAYLDGAGIPVVDLVDPARLVATADLTVVQPVMTAVTKTGNTLTNPVPTTNTASTPLNVIVGVDTVQFRVESCNTTGLAPAYSVQFSDVLATQLNETTLTVPVVRVGGGLPLTAGVDYIYTGPTPEPPVGAGRGDTIQFELLVPVNPTQCVTLDYEMGIHTDFPPTQVWSNSVTLDEYWSLPASSGQQYIPLGSAQFYMTNISGDAPMSKVVTSPASGEITIGEEVVYTITLPIIPNTFNAALDNVSVEDILHPALEFIEATATIDGVAIDGTTTQVYTVTNVGQDVNMSISQIPANKQVIITLRARLLNNSAANAGVSFSNTATYLSDNNPVVPVEAISGALLIVEPRVAIGKTVVNKSNPGNAPNPGDILTYSLTFTATGGANFSDAFDLRIDDTLSLGLLYLGTPTVNGVGNTIGAPTNNGGDGITTQQTLTWDLAAAIPADIDIVEGTTVTVTYDVSVLGGVQPGQNLSNSASAQWTGLDTINPLERTGTNVPTENDYFTGLVTTTLATQSGPLSKVTTQPTALIGEQFTYLITVPATPQTTDLNNVRILDDLNASAADMTFISVADGGGTATWDPGNISGDTKNLIIENSAGSSDIPAGDQVVIAITVQLDNTGTNVRGLVFNNTADYTYNVTRDPGMPGTSGDMTIIGADFVELIKTGPATMSLGVPETFTISVQNFLSSTATAWDMTVTDVLPNPTPGGMCDVAPTNITAQIFQMNGTTAVSPVLTAGSDYVTSFSGAPSCVLTVTMQSAAGAIAADQQLIITYDAALDADNFGGTVLTNIAAATRWFSADTDDVVTTAPDPIITYTGTLTDGTVGAADEQDAHSTTVESPVLIFQKSVVNVTRPALGADAEPGDTLRYTIYVENTSAFNLPNFSIVDELDALNVIAMFVPGSLSIVSVPAGTDNTDPNGGVNGTGLLDVINLSLAADDNSPGGADTLEIVFDVTLVPAITNNTIVLNQAQLSANGLLLGVSDDPNINGADDPNIAGGEDPTETQINSAPILQIEKISTDLTGDPAVLEAGDTLRYTLTVKNIGNENTVNTLLSDQIPSNTTYVAGSTILNTVVIADPSANVSALAAGLLINAPEDTTAGFMRADADIAANNVATITFDVVINSSAIGGTVISNQGFVSGDGAGSGPFPQRPSDDPATALPDDPTIDVVGNIAVIDVVKTVVIQTDLNANGRVDPDDTLRYTITSTNIGSVPATDVVLTDAIPADTTYFAASTTLNGVAVSDPSAGVSPLEGGMSISSSDQVLPAGAGIMSAGQSAVVIFDVQVNSGTILSPPIAPAPGTIISNQGFVTGNGLPVEPSDADGIDGNGDQPTVVVVGNVELLSITKEVLVVGGGAALAGGQLEYVVRVTNVGSIAATNVVITDNLDSPLAGQMTYIANSGVLNGLAAGVDVTGLPVIAANYSTTYGDLAVGGVAELRFRVLLDGALNIGDVVSNTAEVNWNGPASPLTAIVDISIGGTPGTASLSGQVWSDNDFDETVSTNEILLQDWRVELYRNNVLIGSVLTDVNGMFELSGLVPNLSTGDVYDLLYFAPGADANTAALGTTTSVFTNGPQQITDILVASGTTVQNLNLPRQANGVVYDSVLRTPVAGVRLTMINQTQSNQEVSATCFSDPRQQNQVTIASGHYKFDLNYGDPSCSAGNEYVIQVQPPATGYVGTTSTIVPPVEPVTGTAQDVPSCITDKITTTISHCENSESDEPAPVPVSALTRTANTEYYLKFIFNSVFSRNQIYNNHIPVDPELDAAVAISKVAGMLNVTRSQLVPYTITFNNTLGVTLFDLSIVDNFPAGFKYVEGSASVDNVEAEPQINGRQLTWSNLTTEVNGSHVIKLLLIVGSGVGEGEYINTAQAINAFNGGAASGVASATVNVIPDPTFDCSDIIGKVYDDGNMNAYQDEGEKGLAGVQVATARGLRVTTDEYGRFHITCAVVPDEVKGSNFIIKLDERTLPSGYRITTENPRVQRATRGKMQKFNFGAAIHRIVRLDLADGVFKKGSTELRPQWRTRIDMLIIELQKDPSILRLSYLGENETESEVDDRLDVIEDLISARWKKINCCYKLTIEKEVFWRKGNPSDRMRFE